MLHGNMLGAAGVRDTLDVRVLGKAVGINSLDLFREAPPPTCSQNKIESESEAGKS